VYASCDSKVFVYKFLESRWSFPDSFLWGLLDLARPQQLFNPDLCAELLSFLKGAPSCQHICSGELSVSRQLTLYIEESIERLGSLWSSRWRNDYWNLGGNLSIYNNLYGFLYQQKLNACLTLLYAFREAILFRVHSHSIHRVFCPLFHDHYKIQTPSFCFPVDIISRFYASNSLIN